MLLSEFTRGKLVWKVDWPMRWAFEGVDFEPSGVDHSSPGSSYEVGGLLVSEIFGGRQPIGPMYAFVGISGQAKMSSSKGGVPTPASALEVFEVPLLRWLYARRRPNQAIKVAFDAELQRLYDEWDAMTRKVAAGTTGAIETLGHTRAVSTAERTLPTTPQPVSFRTLTSVVDVTTGDPQQLGRILTGLVAGDPEEPVTLDDLRPRLDRAEQWVEHYMPEEAHTRLLPEPDTALLDSLDDTDRESLRLLLDGLEQDWSLDGPDLARLRRPEAPGRAADGHAAHRRAQGRPAPVLRAALPAARRVGHRSPAAHAAAGRGPGQGALRAHRVIATSS